MIVGCLVLACVMAGGGLGLLLHHGWAHARCEDDRARRESSAWVCYFQPSDMRHFETWVLVLLTNSVTLGVPGMLLSRGVVLAVALGLCVGSLVLMVPFVLACAAPTLQNVSNHETWILVALTNAASLFWLFAIS